MGTRLPHRRHSHTLSTRTHLAGQHRQRRPVCDHRSCPTSPGHSGDCRLTRATSRIPHIHAPPTFFIPHDHTRGDDTHSVSTTIGDPHHTPGDNAQTMSTTIADNDTRSRPDTGSTPRDHDHSHHNAKSTVADPDTGHCTASREQRLPNSCP